MLNTLHWRKFAIVMRPPRRRLSASSRGLSPTTHRYLLRSVGFLILILVPHVSFSERHFFSFSRVLSGHVCVAQDVSVSRSRDWVRFTMTVADAADAFAVAFSRFVHADSKKARLIPELSVILMGHYYQSSSLCHLYE